jgi:hypothetical protein
MSELSAIELKILENLVDCLESAIGVKMLNYTDKDRLLYVSCTNEVEKVEVTKTQIKKLQKKVNKCSSEIAPYIMEVLRPEHPHNKDFYDLRKTLCQNYLLDFPDELSYISENYKTIESVPDDFETWDIILFRDNIIYNTDNNISFVKFMATAERLLNYKSILEYNENNKMVNNENNSNFSNLNFIQFIKDLEYNYPLYHTPISSFHQWQTNLKYLKQEILSNLIVLSGDSKKPYLKKLLFDIQEHYQYVHTVKSDVDELYDLYDTNEYKVLHERSYKNELHVVLNNLPKNYELPTEETFKINPFHIQERFYNYHYGVTIRDAVDFIKFQEIEYGYREIVELEPVNILDINKISNTNIKHKSFKYTNNDSTRLPDLMNALIIANFIDKETEIKQFRKIFSGNEIDIQIIWIGNISELSYFIKSIHNVHKKIEDTKQQIWKITSQCKLKANERSYFNTRTVQRNHHTN